MENKITNKESGTLTALKAKKYRLFWTASIASVGATQLLTLTAGKLVFDLSGSEFLLGLAAAVFGIGTIVINFLGGVVADRIDKRILMIITSFSMSISLLFLAIIDALNFETVLLVVIFSTIMGLSEIDGGVTVHNACHARAQNMGIKARDMLKFIPNVKMDVVERCAGHGVNGYKMGIDYLNGK